MLSQMCMYPLDQINENITKLYVYISLSLTHTHARMFMYI